MSNVEIRELTQEGFSAYGSFANMTQRGNFCLGGAPVEFFPDLVRLRLGGKDASFSICRVAPRPYVIDVSERHVHCGEGIMPLDGDVLVHVGASEGSEVPLERIEVFRVPKWTMIALNPGVWHHGPFALDHAGVNVLIVLPEKTYERDSVVEAIAEEDRVYIKGMIIELP